MVSLSANLSRPVMQIEVIWVTTLPPPFSSYVALVDQTSKI